jgi:hypothetical protein
VVVGFGGGPKGALDVAGFASEVVVSWVVAAGER